MKIYNYIKRNAFIIGLVAIFLVGLALRLYAISWSIDSSLLRSLHPDENFTLRALVQINPIQGDFIAELAHREGTLFYYLFIAFNSILKIINVSPIYTWDLDLAKDKENYFEILLIGRYFIAFLGSLSILAIYKLMRTLNLSKAVGLITAAVIAVAPIDVIYSHYMRPHVVVNLLFIVSLIFLFSSSQKLRMYKYIIVGLIIGLSTAMRYNMALTIVIPFIYIFVSSLQAGNKWKQVFFKKEYIVIAICFVVGFFIGDPQLFLNFEAIKPALEYQSGFVEENTFALSSLLSLSGPIKYFTYLIPAALGVYLAVVSFFGSVYTLMIKKYYRVTIPLIAYSIMYIYFMGKGYSQPIYARATLPLIPISAILIGFTYQEIILAKIKSYIRIAMLIFLSIGFLSNLFFNLQYFYTISQTNDPAIILSKEELFNENNSIALMDDYICTYYLETASNKRLSEIPRIVVSGSCETDIVQNNYDKIVFCSYGKESEDIVQEIVKNISKDKVVEISRTPDIPMDLPHDMLYHNVKFYIISK
jgi:hypothetical protein